VTQQPPHDDDRAVRNGLLALVGVSVAVGLVLAVVALIGTHVLGIAGGGGDDGAGSRESMYLPPPAKSVEPGGPLVTLNTQAASSPSDTASASESASRSASPKNKKRISLQALETTVPNFGKIDLTGTYPGGEGEILQVQRKQGGAWTDFAATVPVSGETFSTYVQTGQAGKNVFRVLDKTRHVASNPVDVTVH